MKKRAKSKATIGKADRALQNWYRGLFLKHECEICGRKAEVMHHHISKSKSNYLRFNRINLISLCHSCHSKIAFGDYNIVANYTMKRGRRWLDEINKLKRIKKSYYSKAELEELIEKFECPIK